MIRYLLLSKVRYLICGNLPQIDYEIWDTKCSKCWTALVENFENHHNSQETIGAGDSDYERLLKEQVVDHRTCGLGTSLASSVEKQAPSITSKTSKASAITRSAAAPSNTMTKVSGLSSKAVSRVHEHVLRPLRAKPELKDFEPIVLDIPRRIRDKEIICLRDLEKTLIFMAPERAKTAALYLDFCLTSIRCIQATVEYLSDREQIRPADRPYTNGYFIDLVEQIRQYAGQLATAKEAGVEGREMDVDPTDEVKLFGGISQNGRPAELVRVRKDGQAISMATGLPVDMDEDGKDFPRLKRSLSQQLADDEEIMRSMARRKKNAAPEELAPKKCREPGCNKEFKRPCDLTKHEKTHSRPWKCPVKTCKYHETLYSPVLNFSTVSIC
ncbi:hypothetical protein BN1723_009796 [Verticillium longisporum]|uniref:C2H2-type domain-containing protein n=1 Tax=Verticillium longisporum TaxID=100787 RepID=A0A0G4KTU1_VERLO|nr:hypothetical protein BN1723_009796 [Verticillium longisporum]